MAARETGGGGGMNIIWAIGFLFTYGISFNDMEEMGRMKYFKCVLIMVILWPFVLGMCLADILEKGDPK